MTISKEEIKEIFHEVVEEHNAKTWPSQTEHYIHHRHFEKCLALDAERIENHLFVSEIRFNIKATKRSAFRAGLYLLGVGILLLWAYAAKTTGWTP
jgi:hypothetical protein